MTNADEKAPPSGWRYWLGVGLLVLSTILPLVALALVPLFGFPEGVNVVVFGLSLAGGPELLLVLAIAAMGNENIERILGKYLPLFKRLFRWDTVTRPRYIFGLWVLAIAAVVPWVLIYFWEESLANANGKPDWGYYVIIASNLAFIAAVFVMGAPLWQRIMAVFTWDAQISFPSEKSKQSGQQLSDKRPRTERAARQT